MHRTTDQFRHRRDALPQDIQEQADRAFALLKSNPKHPSLHFKKTGPFWSARVGQAYRALAGKTEKTSSGCGLAHTTNTSAFSGKGRE